jgi:hypothetical protein
VESSLLRGCHIKQSLRRLLAHAVSHAHDCPWAPVEPARKDAPYDQEKCSVSLSGICHVLLEF